MPKTHSPSSRLERIREGDQRSQRLRSKAYARDRFCAVSIHRCTHTHTPKHWKGCGPWRDLGTGWKPKRTATLLALLHATHIQGWDRLWMPDLSFPMALQPKCSLRLQPENSRAQARKKVGLEIRREVEKRKVNRSHMYGFLSKSKRLALGTHRSSG